MSETEGKKILKFAVKFMIVETDYDSITPEMVEENNPNPLPTIEKDSWISLYESEEKAMDSVIFGQERNPLLEYMNIGWINRIYP